MASKSEDEKSPEQRVAKAIFDALNLADQTAFISGSPESGRTIIDGTFNLEAVARLILWEVRKVFDPLRP